jgi:pimeloyl-ACP methyl ester carboxylesterase
MSPRPSASVFSLAVSLLLPALALTAAPEPIPVGPGQVVVALPEPITVFTYKPPTYRDGPLILVFHGVGRNAEEYRNFAITLGERFKAVVAAPLFDKERFPTERYQRGGLMKGDVVQPAEAWTFAMVPRIVDDLRAREGKPDQPYWLIGHSAGGQFLVRMAAFLPGEARRIVAANPGSHLFPRLDVPYGYGFGNLPAALADEERLRRYLAAPLTLYLGTGDTDPNDDSLDRSEPALAQGPYRYARGLACFAFARTLAASRGWPFAWRLVEAPRIGHVAAEMFAAPEAEAALFGDSGK